MSSLDIAANNGRENKKKAQPFNKLTWHHSDRNRCTSASQGVTADRSQQHDTRVHICPCTDRSVAQGQSYAVARDARSIPFPGIIELTFVDLCYRTQELTSNGFRLSSTNDRLAHDVAIDDDVGIRTRERLRVSFGHAKESGKRMMTFNNRDNILKEWETLRVQSFFERNAKPSFWLGGFDVTSRDFNSG